MLRLIFEVILTLGAFAVGFQIAAHSPQHVKAVESDIKTVESDVTKAVTAVSTVAASTTTPTTTATKT